MVDMKGTPLLRLIAAEISFGGQLRRPVRLSKIGNVLDEINTRNSRHTPSIKGGCQFSLIAIYRKILVLGATLPVILIRKISNGMSNYHIYHAIN